MVARSLERLLAPAIASGSNATSVSSTGQVEVVAHAAFLFVFKGKKWRRLRGAVDEKKLPSKWYCSMNKNDPDRARCSAPEEEYEAPATPESAADARARAEDFAE